MTDQEKLDPTILVIFGAGGDLTWRKLVPALYNLCLDNLLPDRFAIFGVDLKGMSVDDFRLRMRQGVDQFSRRGKSSEEEWNTFAPYLNYLPADFNDPKFFELFSGRLQALEEEWGAKANYIFYQATPPAVVRTIVDQLGKAQLNGDRKHARIVLEQVNLDLARRTKIQEPVAYRRRERARSGPGVQQAEGLREHTGEQASHEAADFRRREELPLLLPLGGWRTGFVLPLKADRNTQQVIGSAASWRPRHWFF